MKKTQKLKGLIQKAKIDETYYPLFKFLFKACCVATVFCVMVTIATIPAVIAYAASSGRSANNLQSVIKFVHKLFPKNSTNIMATAAIATATVIIGLTTLALHEHKNNKNSKRLNEVNKTYQANSKEVKQK